MSIFNRHSQSNVEQPSAAPSQAVAQRAQADRGSKATPPVATPGVVPPAAAPIYSTLAPEPGAHANGADATMAERLRMAREKLESAQVSVAGSVRVAAQRTTRTAARTNGARRTVQQPPARTRGPQPFDAARAASTGLLHLAWSWQDAGAPIRAIHTYMQVLHRYPASAAAEAAVADLVELSGKLVGQGQFHTALAIYDELERLT